MNWGKAQEKELNAKNCHAFEIGKSAMRPTWTYKLGQNINKKKKRKIQES